MIICNLCTNDVNIPIGMTCNHIVCFICLLSNTYKNRISCRCSKNIYNFNIQNNQIMNKRFDNYIWLYSSNLHDTWWCYDQENIRDIQHIYMNYIDNKKILLSINDNDNDIRINMQYKKSSSSNNLIENDQNFDIIDFNKNEDEDVLFNDQTYNESYIKKPNKNRLSYIIKINFIEYKIDFDSMKQINLADPWKKRNIKKIIIPDEIINTNVNNIIHYLKNTHNVIGISGIKF